MGPVAHKGWRLSRSEAVASERPAWQARPAIARVLRVGAWLLPFAASSAAVYIAAQRFPRPPGTLASLLWLAVLSIVGSGSLVMSDRVSRRLLPLAAANEIAELANM